MNRRVRLEDIAKELGVSINTVSLALKDSERIHARTRRKVHEMAKALNYIPNSVARSLVQKKSNVIGFILPKITNPVQIETAQNIERVLVASGRNMMLMTTDHDAEYESYVMDILVSRQVDGIFLFPSKIYNQEKIRSIRAANYPIILLSSGDSRPSSDAVYMNKFRGAYKATTHLIRLGHRRVAFICGGIINDAEKHSGYKAAIEDSGLVYDPKLIVTVDHFTYDQGYRSVSKLSEEQTVFTAVLASGDHLALGVLRWCLEHNLRVPEDVSIVGFDNLEDAKYAEIPITSVSYELEQMSNRATDLLFDLIASESPLSLLEPRRIEIEPSLVIRASCGYSNTKEIKK